VFLLQAEVLARAGGTTAQIPLPAAPARHSALATGGIRPVVPAIGTTALLTVYFQKQHIWLQYVSRGVLHVSGSRPELG
jgi:hypothetical protein